MTIEIRYIIDCNILFPLILLQKEQKVHKEKMKGTAFKLNMHPQDFFDPNPFLTSTGHPERKPKPSQKKSGKPFYPSHIGLKVMFILLYIKIIF